MSRDVSVDGGSGGGAVSGKKKGKEDSKGKERKSRMSSQDWVVYMNSTGGEEEQ